MRIYDYLDEILRALNAEESSGVPTPSWRIEEYLKDIYDAIRSGIYPSDEQVAEAIDAWLDDHPEATTTVQDGAITNAKLASSFVTPGTAAAYSSSATYAVGDYVFYGGTLYRCITAITTAEAWTSAHWTAAVLGDDVGDLKSAVDDISSPINIYFPITESINLIDPTKWQDGKWINADGSIVSNDYGGTVIVVNVESGKRLYLTYNDNSTSFLSTIRFATYGSTGNVVSVSNGAINGMLVGDDVTTIAICVGVASKQTHLCLTYGRAYGYIPYTETERKVDVEKILNPVLNTVGIFNSIGAIGDSYTIASAKSSDGTWSNCQNQAYVAVLGKRSDVAYANFGVSGANTRTYQTASGGLSAVLAAPANDFYFLALGINDVSLGASYIGSVADINDADYTQNADTFFGNYGKIIEQVKAHAPKAKFCMVNLALRPNTTADDYCDAVEAIANHYGFPIIDQMDDPYFFSAVWGAKNDSHPTPMGYVGMALAYERLLSKAIMQNPGYFEFSTIG